ncbi:host specificity factor TipJ family phage tail protein [Alloalcanivorax sp. C16-1]|uniref:host specificity factor TipJ family phage tail protein n=1 Tax=Alloalcanivorax sp. C16-1 TaxID=3390051 RepID=UPI00397079E0
MPVELVAKPHPLRADTYTCQLDEGATLLDLVGEQPLTVHAQVNGTPWPRARWAEPLPDGLVTLYTVPQGDDLGRIALMIGVAIAAAYTGGLAAGALGLTGNTAIAVQAGVSAIVSVAGSLAVNALIPPKQPDVPANSGGSTIRSSLTGTANRPNPYGVVPRAYGSPRWFPPLAANPVTEVDSDEQYLRMLLCLGYGPLAVGGQVVAPGAPLTQESQIDPGQIRIGETPIEEFEDVEWEIGYPDDISLFSQSIDEEALGISMPMEFDGKDPQRSYKVEIVGDTGDIRQWFDYVYRDTAQAVRTTSPATREFVVDLVAPQGLYLIQDDGLKYHARVRFRIEYRPTGGDAWTLADDFEIRGGGGADATLRRTYRYPVPLGQYDVRVTRVETALRGKAMQTIADFTWTALRSVRSQSPYNGDHVLMALRIRATDQLNNVVDELSLRTTAVLRIPDGAGGFTVEPTTNPAWAYLDALTGPQVSRPVEDSRINWAALTDWAAWCEAQGLNYHHVHDASETLFDRARAIAAGGQASFSLQDGLFGMVRDDPDAPLVQMISPRNARGFESSRQYKALPHALRVKYVDPDSWTDAERIVYRSGYDQSNATEFEDFQTQGVASAEEAWHHGNYYFRQAELRPETYQAEMDWENLACVRGNRVRLAYDTILVGLGAGVITDLETDGTGAAVRLVLDEEVPAGADSVRIRTGAGAQPVVGFTLDGDELVLAEPVPGVGAGDLVLMGEAGRESIDCKITKIQPGPDFTASLTLVDAATDIYDFSAAPAFDPGITVPPRTVAPPADLQVTSGLDQYTVQPDGAIRSRARVSWAPVTGAAGYELLYRRTEADAWTPINTGQTTAYIDPVFDGEHLTVRVRARDTFGRESDWADAEHTVVAASEFGDPVRLPVPNVSGVELFEQGNDPIFGGRDAKIVWRASTVTQWRDLGWEINGAGDGALDPYFRDYQVEVWADVGGTLSLVRTEPVTDPQFVYTYEKNAEDHARETGTAGAWRAFEVRVYCRGRQNQISAQAAVLAVENVAPGLPEALIVAATFRAIEIDFDVPEDLDYRETRVWLSQTPGFTPAPANQVAQTFGGPIQVGNLADDTTFYLRLATFDAFGQGTMSQQFTVTTPRLSVGDVDGLGPWASVTEADRDFIEEHLADDSVEGTKIVKLTASKIVTGTLAATEKISVEGQVESVVGDAVAALGPKAVGNRTGLITYFYAGDPLFAVLDDGSVEMIGNLTIPGSAGATANLSAIPTTGLNVTPDHLGYYDGANWTAYIDDGGDFYFGDGDEQYFKKEGAELSIGRETVFNGVDAFNAKLLAVHDFFRNLYIDPSLRSTTGAGQILWGSRALRLICDGAGSAEFRHLVPDIRSMAKNPNNVTRARFRIGVAVGDLEENPNAYSPSTENNGEARLELFRGDLIIRWTRDFTYDRESTGYVYVDVLRTVTIEYLGDVRTVETVVGSWGGPGFRYPAMIPINIVAAVDADAGTLRVSSDTGWDETFTFSGSAVPLTFGGISADTGGGNAAVLPDVLFHTNLTVPGAGSPRVYMSPNDIFFAEG